LGGKRAVAITIAGLYSKIARRVGLGRVVAAMETRGGGIPDEQLAEAAGLSVPRVYQIRDGRR
jgi:hypothetical protein